MYLLFAGLKGSSGIFLDFYQSLKLKPNVLNLIINLISDKDTNVNDIH